MFIQIDNIYLNTNHISTLYILEEKVMVETTGGKRLEIPIEYAEPLFKFMQENIYIHSMKVGKPSN